MTTYVIDPSKEVPVEPGSYTYSLRTARGRVAEVDCMEKAMAGGMSSADALVHCGSTNEWLRTPGAGAKSRAWLAKVEAHGKRVLGDDLWALCGDDIELVDMAYDSVYCFDGDDAVSNRERRKMLRWSDAMGRWVGARGPHREYTAAQRDAYARAYALLSDRVTEHSYEKRRTRWRRRLRSLVRNDIATRYDGATGESVSAEELDDLCAFQFLYYVANGFTWGDVWEVAERLSDRELGHVESD